MRKFIRILAIVYLVYLGLVLLVVTPALYFLPPKLVKDYLGRELNAGFILFNPFTLSLEARKLALPEHDGSPFVSLDSASVNLSLASIWSPGFVFDRVAVQGLLVNIKQAADGSFNFDDMIPPEDPDAPPEEPTDIPGITINQLDFHARRLMFSSAAREKPYSTQLDNLAINVAGLSTVLEEGKPYRLDAYGEGGGELHWEGEVSIPRGRSEGTLRLATLYLPQIWRALEPWVAFEVRQGDLSIGGHYTLEWQDELAYSISRGEVSINGVDIQPREADTLPDTSLNLGNLTLSGIELDSGKQHLAIDTLGIAELAVRGWSEGSDTSLARLFSVKLPEDESQQAPPAQDEADEPGWTAQLKRFQLADSELHWRSEFTDPARLEILPITASASSLSWPLAGDSELSLALGINGLTSASVDGTLDLGTGKGQLNYKLEALPLPWFNPNLPPPLKAKITSGEFRVAGDVGLAEFAPTVITADGAITAFSGELEGAEESLTSWETVRWDKLAVDLEQQSVSLEKLSIDNYVGRIHINQDGSINAQNAWQAELASEPEQTGEAPAADAAAKAGSEEAEKPWAVSVPLIQITDSEIDFKDESLPINFRTVIGDINGDISDLSSQPDSPTTVDIKGSVDGYAPVTFSGTAEPLRSPPALDLALTFKGVDMSLLSPYSGTYAGYAIEQGVLDLDLKYGLREDRLDGRNKIVIHQMELGEKIESEQAADLPLELALALLTDSQGVVDMDIPVSGDVNDPEFSVGNVLLGAFVNLITKAVTAPFNLLAGLVDSEEDLQRLNFSSGSSELTDSTRAKLDDLSSALSQRPELGLGITGRLQVEADRERLQKNILGSELVAAGLSQQELADKAPAWEAAISARYRDMAGEPGELSVRDQYQALVERVPLPDDALLDLAQARAVAVKTYLVNDKGLDPSRAAIGQANLKDEQNLYSGVELSLDV